MQYKNDSHSFTLPDAMPFRDMANYWLARDKLEEAHPGAVWATYCAAVAAQTADIITDATFPPIEEKSDTGLVMWVGVCVIRHIEKLLDIPKV